MNRQDYLDSSNVQLEFLEAIGLTVSLNFFANEKLDRTRIWPKKI